MHTLGQRKARQAQIRSDQIRSDVNRKKKAKIHQMPT